MKKFEPGKEALIFVAAARHGDAHHTPDPSDTASTCVKCGHAVWLRPDSVQLAIHNSVPVYCIECAAELYPGFFSGPGHLRRSSSYGKKP